MSTDKYANLKARDLTKAIIRQQKSSSTSEIGL